MSIETKKFLDFLEKNKILHQYLKKLSNKEVYKLLQTSGYEFSFEEFQKTWVLINKTPRSSISS